MSIYGSSVYERTSYVHAREAPLARWLFSAKAAAWIWLVARVWLGYAWVNAGTAKVFGADRAGWMNGGEALRGAAAAATGDRGVRPLPGGGVTDGWWAGFLGFVQDNAAWMAQVVAVGELVTGAALLLGAFTGAAAFAGLLLGAVGLGGLGSAAAGGLSPLVVAVAVLLVAAWRNAGWIGLDRRLLRGRDAGWSRGDIGYPRPAAGVRVRALR